MRAAIFHGPGRPITVETLPDPEPGPDDLLVKVCRCGICGSDVVGTADPTEPLPLGRFGHEWAGEVIETGRNVESFRPGDRISALPIKTCGVCSGCRTGNLLLCEQANYLVGGFGEYMVIPEVAANPLPSSLSFAEGALIEPMACGLHALRLAGMTGGERVLIIGAGSMALSLVYWARKLGAAKIAVLSRSAHREEVLMTMGADAVQGFGEEDISRIVSRLGGPPDIVGECVGKPGMLDLAIRQVRPQGTVLSMGMCRSAEPIVPSSCTHRELRLLFPVAYTAAEFAETARAFDAGRLDMEVMVSDVIALDELSETMAGLQAGTRQALKILVDPFA